ncbi:hypothetical protein U1Q18_022971 [Sarracenia purpurea var. burkii]
MRRDSTGSSEIFEIDVLLNVGLHIEDDLKMNIGLKESSHDLVKAFIEDLLVDDCRIAHVPESVRYAPPNSGKTILMNCQKITFRDLK